MDCVIMFNVDIEDWSSVKHYPIEMLGKDSSDFSYFHCIYSSNQFVDIFTEPLKCSKHSHQFIKLFKWISVIKLLNHIRSYYINSNWEALNILYIYWLSEWFSEEIYNCVKFWWIFMNIFEGQFSLYDHKIFMSIRKKL